MKNINKILLILLIVFGGLTSCQKDSNEKNDFKEKFEESVALIQQDLMNSESLKSSEYAIIIELKDFSGEIELNPVYKIDCIEYCDNGLFNDEIAGDGIYTSVEKFNIDNLKFSNNTVKIGKSTKFKYNEQLKSYLNQDAFKLLKISAGCSVRWVECPDEHWYDTDLFGEGCLEFYDCHAEFELSWEL